jgi:single-strand DNA-binding protein
VSGRLEQRSWETDQGEKRSIVEIVADDIAPSLRFATAEIHKVERSGPGEGGGGGGGGQRRQPAAAPSGGGGGGGGGTENYDQYGEEPF